MNGTIGARAALRVAVAATTALVATLAVTTTALAARPHRTRSGAASAFTAAVFASATGITHPGPNGTREPISLPDDITYLGGDIFVGFQNGVGPQGQPSTTGNLNSTVVEFNLQGREVKQWDVRGKCDGLTAWPARDKVIATVNEDANSSVYLINPNGVALRYLYNRPLPSFGGTDAISIYQGAVLISASAPGTTGQPAPQPTYPAVYRVSFDSRTRVASITAFFFDEDMATIANGPQPGAMTKLMLTDPDSNEDVPFYADRFAGDFMLTSQGDKEQIFTNGLSSKSRALSVLDLTQAVDDTAWPSGPNGTLYTTDNSGNTIYAITGPFVRGSVWVAATPCDANDAPPVCPGPGFPPNYLATENPFTGVITQVTVQGPMVEPQGMLFLRK